MVVVLPEGGNDTKDGRFGCVWGGVKRLLREKKVAARYEAVVFGGSEAVDPSVVSNSVGRVDQRRDMHTQGNGQMGFDRGRGGHGLSQ